MTDQAPWHHYHWAPTDTYATVAQAQQGFLRQRSLAAPDALHSWLHGSLADLPTPAQMHGLVPAAQRLSDAIDAGQRIMVYGDFDTDGITSTATLVWGLRQLGAEVSYRIPDRVRDSHGLRHHLIDEIAASGATVLLTCDCGINDHHEVTYATQLGLTVIITDHHQSDPARFPHAAHAVVNPHQAACTYPEQVLAGVGVAWKLICGLTQVRQLSASRTLQIIEPLLEFVAIGLVADCVPLIGENRILVKAGLAQLQHSRWPGLRQLLREVGDSGQPITEETIGFTIAPRLNAASRLGEVQYAVGLLIGDESRHPQRVAYLQRLNSDRRALTHECVTEALLQVEDLSHSAGCYLVGAPHWPEGILGLVASRLVEQLGRPVVALRYGEQTLKASCRAPAGFDMHAGLASVSPWLTRWGGHAGAAGFSAPAEHFTDIRAGLATHWPADTTQTVPVQLDAFLTPQCDESTLLDWFDPFRPWGVGNPQPVYAHRRVTLTKVKFMGQHHNHLRLECVTDTGHPFAYVAFFADHLTPHLVIGHRYDVAFTLSWNHWNGTQSIQRLVQHIRQVGE